MGTYVYKSHTFVSIKTAAVVKLLTSQSPLARRCSGCNGLAGSLSLRAGIEQR